MSNLRKITSFAALAGMLFLLFLSPASADQKQPSLVPFAPSDRWSLPMALTDQNTKVSFEVDSTWHLVHGTTRQVTGNLQEKNVSTHGKSVQAHIEMPVAEFNTENRSRDRKLKKVMAAAQFPKVVFDLESAELCKPEHAPTCQGTLTGKLTIREYSKELTIPYLLTASETSDTISGSFAVSWAEFNVEDPSIVVAYLEPIVQIQFEVDLERKK